MAEKQHIWVIEERGNTAFIQKKACLVQDQLVTITHWSKGSDATRIILY